MIGKQYKSILVLTISILVLGYIFVIFFPGVENQDPEYKIVSEGPKIFNGEADKLSVEGILKLSIRKNKNIAYGSIENNDLFYNLVIETALLNKIDIDKNIEIGINRNIYIKKHKVKISNQIEHYAEPEFYKIYKIVEIIE